MFRNFKAEYLNIDDEFVRHILVGILSHLAAA